MDKNSNLSTPVRNITLKIWDLFFDLMQKETKLQQKLFDKGTLTWKNESHTQNEKQPNEMKKQNKMNDFVNNPFQFDFFFGAFVLYWSNLFDFKGSSIPQVLSLFQISDQCIIFFHICNRLCSYRV